ncbi:MAG TPA: helix-turn-helix domain-containing protein [Polyangiaceae bacterium]
MSATPDRLAVTLTVNELRELVRGEVQAALGAKVDDEVLTRDQVAKLLRVDPHTVTRYALRHRLPGSTIGGRWRFRRVEVLRWMEQR